MTTLTGIAPSVAAEIMGPKYFHGSDAVERHMGEPLADEVCEVIPFDAEMLERCRNTHVLTGVKKLTLAQVWQRHSGLFGRNPAEMADGNYLHANIYEDLWMLLRRGPLPGSMGLSWRQCRQLINGLTVRPEYIGRERDLDEQERLDTQMAEIEAARAPFREIIPMATSVAQAIIIHQLETGERLFPDMHIFTDDLTSVGSHLTIGSTASRIQLSWVGAYSEPGTGLAAAVADLTVPPLTEEQRFWIS